MSIESRGGIPESVQNWKAPDNDPHEAPRQVESKDTGEELQENDLIVSDFGIESSRHLLKERDIQFADRQRTQRLTIDAKSGTAVPGEFVLTIFDVEHPDRPAPFEFVKEVRQFLEEQNIAARFGKNPEAES